MPAMPAAETATAKEDNGDGEERISSPPVCEIDDDIWRARPGSGRPTRADTNEREKEVIVERRIE